MKNRHVNEITIMEAWAKRLFTYYFGSGAKWKLHKVCIVVRSGVMQYAEYILPARLDIPGFRTDHLCDAVYNHIPDYRRAIWLHDVLKRSKKIFLEPKMRKFTLLQKLHGKLPQRIDGETSYFFIVFTSNLKLRLCHLYKWPNDTALCNLPG